MLALGKNLHRIGFRGTTGIRSSARMGTPVQNRFTSPRVAKRDLKYSKILHQEKVPLRQFADTFMEGTSSTYIEDMFRSWSHDPSSVHSSWASYFKNLEAGVPSGQAFTAPPRPGSKLPAFSATARPGQNVSLDEISENMRLMLLIRSYQIKGHVLADLDPLGLTKHEVPPELDLRSYGFTEADLDREFHVGGIGFGLISGFLADRPTITLRELLSRLREVYCGTIGVEYLHIQDREQSNWLRERLETPNPWTFTTEQKVRVLDGLTRATHFERFLALKWGASKRFGLDGGESLIPGIVALIDRGAELGVENVVMGMPHRGRLSVLANIVGKPLQSIFHEFTGGSAVAEEDDLYAGSGDVKYHLGTSHKHLAANGSRVHISLLANPSHLEAVAPVTEGKARARQHYLGDKKREKTVSVLLHGDASFAAQGVVYETIDLSGLEDYTTGGTIHVIVNNQIGFTTDPRSSRGSMYCTDVAKTGSAPIFHVNGDDPEAVAHCFQLAMEWRQTFHKDVVIDIICYRRFGHNEADEPRYTQPTMYRQVDKQVPVLDIYSEKLISEKVISKEQVGEVVANYEKELHDNFEASKNYVPHKNEWFDSVWKGFRSRKQLARIRNTGVPLETLKKIGNVITHVPDDFAIHPALKRILKGKADMIESGEKLDWGTAEALALGSLLLEGNHVRVSGQDVERGTFSHRHAVLHDQNTNKLYVPLRHLDPKQKEFHISNSSLSEFGVLGFELGYSLENPNSLVIWEAQFGDFANSAQVIIDQFISSGEAKWRRMSGLTLLLPHGYDGMGPEHSSARLERFLQLTDSDPDVIPEGTPEHVIAQTNIQVVNCTTPANYFHVLRRQVHREFRKPLIVMSPKNLLRHRDAVSSLRDMSDGVEHARFYRLLPETHELVEDSKVRKVIFCSGKVYYDLATERDHLKINDVAIVRVEQLHPFPFDRVQEQARKYPNAKVAWVQEEPKNQGAWTWISPHLRTAIKSDRGNDFFPEYVGRPAAAAPATGLGSEHQSQYSQMMADAFAM